jgi:hypothetical protein
MLALGMCVAGRLKGQDYAPADPDETTLYIEFAPISDALDPEALTASHLDRERLIRKGTDPTEAIQKVVAWTRTSCNGSRPVICAYPAGFDWMFFYWYLQRFGREESGINFSSCLDMRTMYAAKAQCPWSEAGRHSLPPALSSPRPHTHNALDDAKEQAEILSKLFAI